MPSKRWLQRRMASANLEHRCSACLAPLPRMSPEDEAKARQEAYAQGMTDEQLAAADGHARICDPCWRRWEARGFPGMTRPS